MFKKKTRKNAIFEYVDYQIPVTQLKGQKGLSDTRYSAKGTKGKWSMQAAKRD